jgi:hypothetical protein
MHTGSLGKKSHNLNHLLFVFILTTNVAEPQYFYVALTPDTSETEPQQNDVAS